MPDLIYTTISPTEITATSLTGGGGILFDRYSYMTSGFGRFATIDRVPLVKWFFENGGGLPAGSYSVTELLDLSGLATTAAEFTLVASRTNIRGPGYFEDAYIWNHTAYTINSPANEDARFVVDFDGSLSLQGFQVRSFDDNFDTESIQLEEDWSNFSTWMAGNAANTYFNHLFSDFGEFGRVDVSFVGNAPILNLTASDFSNLQAATASSRSLPRTSSTRRCSSCRTSCSPMGRRSSKRW
jgi:hypothetical protein